MEQLLHYVWRHRIYPLRPLQTTDGQPLEVIDPGLPHTDAGPDFFNAKVKLGGTLWAGDVEVHDRASDWLRHGHDRDRAYDRVVLHVVGEADCDVFRTNGERIPQLLLPCPDEVRQRYDDLRRPEIFPPCHEILSRLPLLKVHAWFSTLQVERLQQKAEAIRRRLERCGHNWEDACFVTLARNFGFGLNGDAFEAWATRLPLRAVDKHRDNLFQVEAFFFGMAGLLDGEQEEGYACGLRREFAYLQRKFSLPEPMSAGQWRFLRLRPGNFPHVRLAQLAYLYYQSEGLFSRVLEAETVDSLRKLFVGVRTSEFWTEHFHFRKASPRRVKSLGAGAVDLIVLNTVAPMLYAYGQYRSDERLCGRASRLLESLKAEDNSLIRRWARAGLPVRTAADSQALLQLQKEYCDKRDCLRCRFGYEYLKARSAPRQSLTINH